MRGPGLQAAKSRGFTCLQKRRKAVFFLDDIVDSTWANRIKMAAVKGFRRLGLTLQLLLPTGWWLHNVSNLSVWTRWTCESWAASFQTAFIRPGFCWKAAVCAAFLAQADLIVVITPKRRSGVEDVGLYLKSLFHQCRNKHICINATLTRSAQGHADAYEKVKSYLIVILLLKADIRSKNRDSLYLPV